MEAKQGQAVEAEDSAENERICIPLTQEPRPTAELKDKASTYLPCHHQSHRRTMSGRSQRNPEEDADIENEEQVAVVEEVVPPNVV